MVELTKVTSLSWRRFLSTQAGQQGLAWWREKSPPIQSGQPHEIIFSAGKVEGFKEALNLVTEVIGGEIEKEEKIEREYEMTKE